MEPSIVLRSKLPENVSGWSVMARQPLPHGCTRLVPENSIASSIEAAGSVSPSDSLEQVQRALMTDISTSPSLRSKSLGLGYSLDGTQVPPTSTLLTWMTSVTGWFWVSAQLPLAFFLLQRMMIGMENDGELTSHVLLEPFPRGSISLLSIGYKLRPFRASGKFVLRRLSAALYAELITCKPAHDQSKWMIRRSSKSANN